MNNDGTIFSLIRWPDKQCAENESRSENFRSYFLNILRQIHARVADLLTRDCSKKIKCALTMLQLGISCCKGIFTGGGQTAPYAAHIFVF